MTKDKNINWDIIAATEETERADVRTSENDIRRKRPRNSGSVRKSKSGNKNIVIKRPTVTTAPNGFFTDQIYTVRGEYSSKRNIIPRRVKEKFKDDPLIDYYLGRIGLVFTPDEQTFLTECAFPWYNGQCINNTDPDNKYFWVNSITGRRGDIVIGFFENGVPRVMWNEMADDFLKAKGTADEKNARTKTALARRDDQIRNFKKMVCALATDPMKCVIVSELEQNEFGESVSVQNIIQPFKLSTIEINNVKYLLLRFADYFIQKKDKRRSYTKYKTSSPALIKAIQANPKARVATMNLRYEIIVLLSASMKKLNVDEERTKEYNADRKGKKTAHVVKFELKLNTLISTASETNIKRGHHDEAHEDLVMAVNNLKDGGLIYDMEIGENVAEWWATGTRPNGYKKWSDFYNKEKVTLYIVKDI